jgi:hypothetical protein
MTAQDCPFCSDTARFSAEVPEIDWRRISRRLLESVGEVSLCAGLGAIVEPYALAFTHEHFTSISALERKVRHDLFDALDVCLGSACFESNSLCVFEHGGRSSSHVTACLEHCHLHIVDGKFDLREQLLAVFPEAEAIEIGEEGAFSSEPGYLFAGVYSGRRTISGLVVEEPGCGSQFFRRLLAAQRAEEEWNWRLHPKPEAAYRLCQRWRR